MSKTQVEFWYGVDQPGTSGHEDRLHRIAIRANASLSQGWRPEDILIEGEPLDVVLERPREVPGKILKRFLHRKPTK